MRKIRLIKVIAVICALSTVMLFSACESNSNNQIDKNITNSQQDNSNKNNSNIINSIYTNSLTGLEISKNKADLRPKAVMINNIKIAQPLLGISKADIVYECLVEGGITRLMAVYKDISDVECIGSIRSVRPNYLSLMRGLDATILYNGTSTQAKSIIKSDSLSAYDIGYYNNACWRDEYRRKNLGYEHSLLTSGEKLSFLISSVGERTTTSYDVGFVFDDDKSQINNGKNANSMTVRFSSYKTTDFEYDSNKKEYNVLQYNTNQYDGYYNVNNTAKNVIAIFVNCTTIDDEGHIDMEIVSSGNGYYMCDGKYINIKWSKMSDDSPLLFTDESGNELIMKSGRQYVCCVPQYGDVKINA